MSEEPRKEWPWPLPVGIAAAALLFWIICHSIHPASARDPDGRYAASPLKPWFDQLKSGKGLCCSDADGTALSDVDWEAPGQGENRSSHYRVRIEGQWWDVPDEAVITEPNRAGKTMVWPVYYSPLGGPLRIEIRCFMPGSMT